MSDAKDKPSLLSPTRAIRPAGAMVHFLPVFSSAVFSSAVFSLTLFSPAATDAASATEPAVEPVFERDIRPVFEAKCGKCHGESAREANLDLRSTAAILRGGDSGPAVVRDAPESSALLERIDAGEMPPEGQPQLTREEINLIRKWIVDGANSEAADNEKDGWTTRLEEGRDYWAFQPVRRPRVPGVPERRSALSDVNPMGPNHDSLGPFLQAWFRAESIGVGNGERIDVWLDESGNERHLRPTWERVDATVGAPPRLIRKSTVNGLTAVRFDGIAGLGSPGEKPVDIGGDAEWTVTTVVNMRPPAHASHTSVIVGFGDPAPGHNPGRPWASLLEIRRGEASLSHSGGFGHDARMPSHSIWPIYERPIVATVVKRRGAMAETTSIFLNGRRVNRDRLTGVASAPDIRHRDDFGIYMGRAIAHLGAFYGDVAEVAIYNVALDDSQRASLEASLVGKYGISSSAMATESQDAAEALPDDSYATLEYGSSMHPVDAFVREKLHQRGLSSAPLADRLTLIRRACFDLIGLPPKPEEVDAFLSDTAPGAWERVIEGLLDSPHYGERWGRHWLDVARYADTGGYETDIYYRNAWRYRDYVVKSFNDDKPYDRFVQEQIAGDEIWPDNLDLDGSYAMDPEKRRHFEALTGTGMYALGPQIHESNMDARKLMNEKLTDWVDTTTAAFLGLTFGCARCHDHKFDPISQQDYYSLQAVFAGSREVEVPIQHGMGLADWKQHYPKLIAVEEARMAYRDYERRTAGRPRSEAEQQKLAELKNALADRVLALPDRDAQGEVYAGIYERPVVNVLGQEHPELVPQIRLLSRGDLARPKRPMPPRLPEILATQTDVDRVLETAPFGRRKAFALWLTRPDHPLTARVMVNRIWQWHFGRGIVSTANDFGRMGVPPTHPELLDWLAAEFVARGWSIKSMHRLIMTSRTYRQTSAYQTAEHALEDPDNRLLWRMNRRRLEGEAVWDAVHSVAGTINLTVGGRPVMPPLLAEELTSKSNWVESKIPSQHSRRGLYIIARRNFNFPLFDLFDSPVNAVSCSGRDVSTVAPQALWLLNNHLGFNQARHFASRLVREAGRDSTSQVRRAWELALGRPATEEEIDEAVEFIEHLRHSESDESNLEGLPTELAELPTQEAAALRNFCLTLFNLNEFIYVD